MGKMQGFDILDLGGGLNEGQPTSSINPNELTVLRNMYPFGRKLVRRGGVRLISTEGNWDENIFSMFPLKTTDGEWTMLTGGATKLGKLSGDGIADLSTALTIPSQSTQWHWFQYKDYAYTFREGQTDLLRVDATSWSTAGLAAPSVAPTIADGGAGNLTAANYYGVFTFYNEDTGMESNPSPASSVLALGASKMIDWSVVQVSSNAFVQSRRLYRTLPNQVGEYFYCGTISDNTSTVFADDNVIIADLGRAVSFDNGLPPISLIAGTIWKERFFCTDGTELYYSEYLLPECFGDESILSIFPDDGHEIRGLYAFGDRLVIGKTNKIHYLVGADANSFNVLTLSDAHGCMSQLSMKSAEGLLFWYGTGNNFYKTDGNNVVEISTIKMRDTLDLIPDSLSKNVVAAIKPELSQYIVSIPIDETGYNYKVIVYNWKTDSWTTYDHGNSGSEKAPQFIADYYDENLEHILYSTHYDGNIYQYDDTDHEVDFASEFPIEAEVVSRADDYGAPGYRKFFRELWVNCPKVVGGTCTLSAYYDEATTASYSRTASLDISNSAWKAFKLPTHDHPATLLRYGFKYEGPDHISIDGFHVEVGVLERRPTRAY
jgi:hypothetical protein